MKWETYLGGMDEDDWPEDIELEGATDCDEGVSEVDGTGAEEEPGKDEGAEEATVDEGGGGGSEVDGEDTGFEEDSWEGTEEETGPGFDEVGEFEADGGVPEEREGSGWLVTDAEEGADGFAGTEDDICRKVKVAIQEREDGRSGQNAIKVVGYERRGRYEMMSGEQGPLYNENKKVRYWDTYIDDGERRNGGVLCKVATTRGFG
ncbi:hypothetical protein NLI96_g2992 [Meripilus lineatus]|uniref:Uncharacterized protein n=1 Tax=Meripilus lineatus TaxID=2056292 RepID=A0AAD5YH16_9APHY|nr:hypothetical protein NLI96_g2992 [Physisporinus lineatus]